MPNIGEATVRITADATGVEKDITRQVERGAEKAGGIGGNILGTTIGVVAGNALTGIGKIFGDIIGSGFQRLSSIDTAKKKLEGLGHTGESVKGIMDNALASVKGTAFGLGDAASQAATLVASGIKPGQDLTRTLKLLADTTTIAGTSFDDVGQIFRKVATSGSLSTEALMQLQDRGIPALQFLGDTLGVTAEQAQEMVTKGEISFDQFQTAMEKGLGGAAMKSGETFSGAMDNVKAAMARTGASLLTPIFDAAKEIAPVLIAAFDSMAAQLQPVVDKLAPMIAGAFESVAGFISDIDWEMIGGLIVGVADALVDMISFISDNMSIISTFAVLIGVLAAGFMLIKAANVVKLAGGIKQWMMATKVATGIQAAFNLVLAANPILLIVIAIAALVAALVWFFTQTKLGKEIWANFVKFLGDAWTWLWESVLEPVFKFIGDAFDWLWNNAIKPVVDFIVDAWEVLGKIIGFVVDLIVNYFRFWFAVAKWLWENALEPILGKIGELFTWLWENAIKPVIDAIAAAFQWIYNTIIKPIVDLIVLAIKGWGIIFKWLYDTIIKPVWDSIQTVLQAGWKWIDQNVFAPFKTGIDLIAKGFEIARSAIETTWNGIKKAAAVPINFVLDTIWNNGLRSFWNDLVTELDLKDMKLPRAKLVSFARGGILPGYSPGRDIHKFFSPTGGMLALSGGEGIIRPDALRALGGKRWLDAVNGSKGRAIGDGQGDKKQGFLGDAFAWVADSFQVIGDFLTNPAKAIDKYLVQGLIKNKMGNQNIFGQTVAGLAVNTVKRLTHVFDVLAPTEGNYAPSNAIGWQKMWAAVQRVAPWAILTSAYRSPASNAAAGGVKGSYHTQGRAIDLVPASMKTFNMAKALFPNARELIYTPAGAQQLLNGKSFAGWSDYVKRIHYSHIHAAMKMGGLVPTFDNGGWLRPGLAANMTGKPEAVFSASQFDLIRRSLDQTEQMANGGGATVIEKGAIQVVGPDPYKTSLMVVNRIAEKAAVTA